MKRNFYQLVIGVLLVLLLGSGQAFAQNADVFAYNIPFAFRAGAVSMPAGQYLVRIPSAAKGLIFIESLKGAEHAFLLTIPFPQTRSQSVSKLVFNQYGESYFLAKVCNSASGKGQELMKSSAEREFIQRASIPRTVDIALSRR